MADELFFYQSRDSYRGGNGLIIPRYFGYLICAADVGRHYKITAAGYKIVKPITRDEVEAYARTSKPYKEISRQQFDELFEKWIGPPPNDTAAWNRVAEGLGKFYEAWAKDRQLMFVETLEAAKSLMAAYDAWLD